MSQVEMVMTGYSIIVAFCLARLLDGVRPAWQVEKRYWVHYLWIINKIINVIVLYWATWYFLQNELNLAQYFLVLAPPSLVYLQCEALLSKSPDTVEDWRAHFYTNRKFFFFSNFLLSPLILCQLILTGNVFPNAVYALLALLAAMSLLGTFIASPRLHAGLAIIALINLTVGFTAQLSFIE